METAYKPIESITVTTPEVHKKGWGEELWIVNNADYCGKILRFNKGAEFSMHYHMIKHETFFILKGRILLKSYNLSDASQQEGNYSQGTVITIPAGNPHKIIALEETEVMEVSTQHFELDSYRILPGDSQKTKK